MNYIVHHRFRGRGLAGEFNLPRGTKCEEQDGIISYKGRAICLNTSQIAKEHFAVNDDLCGLRRGDITHQIAFGAPLSELQKDITMTDPVVKRYIRNDRAAILFNNSFFHASVLDLFSVCGKLGVKV